MKASPTSSASSRPRPDRRRDPARARLLRAAAALPFVAALPLRAQPSPGHRMNTRPIPSTGEALPVIGCGTYVGFDQAPGTPAYALLARRASRRCSTPAARCSTARRCTAAPRRRPASCSPPTAGAAKRSSRPRSGPRGRAAGMRQMEASFRLLRTDRIDLMQIHNLVDWRTQLATLRALEGANGRIRYLGITHYTASAYARGRGGAARREGSTSCRSTTRSTIATPSSACCRSPPSAASR